MYKLNLTEIELRKKTVDETKDNMVHSKNDVIIDNNTHNDKRKDNSDYEKNNDKKTKRFVTVNAIKRTRFKIKADRNGSYKMENVSGTFIDKLK